MHKKVDRRVRPGILIISPPTSPRRQLTLHLRRLHKGHKTARIPGSPMQPRGTGAAGSCPPSLMLADRQLSHEETSSGQCFSQLPPIIKLDNNELLSFSGTPCSDCQGLLLVFTVWVPWVSTRVPLAGAGRSRALSHSEIAPSTSMIQPSKGLLEPREAH
jgi:hypothetical protein